MTTKSNEIMKIVLTACISIIITGITTWFAFGQNVVSKDYLEHYDQNFSCWAKDKDLITDKLNRINEQNIEALQLIQNLKKTIDDLKYQQKIMVDDLKKHSDREFDLMEELKSLRKNK